MAGEGSSGLACLFEHGCSGLWRFLRLFWGAIGQD